MRIGAGVDQLHVYAHLIAGLLNSSFQHGGDAQLLRDRFQVFRLALVLRGRGAGDDLKVSDRRQLRQDFILNAIGEVGIALVIAQVLEWEDRDRFCRNRGSSAGETVGIRRGRSYAVQMSRL